MSDKKDAAFHKEFYDKNRVPLLQYKSLRKDFNKMIEDTLGSDYYNMAMDVYEADRICCEDVTIKANRTVMQRLFKSLQRLSYIV